MSCDLINTVHVYHFNTQCSVLLLLLLLLLLFLYLDRFVIYAYIANIIYFRFCTTSIRGN